MGEILPCHGSLYRSFLCLTLVVDRNLFVSYGGEITPVKLDHGFEWWTGYDHVLDGPIIPTFIQAVGRFSDYDVTAIRAMLDKKRDWYRSQSQV